MASRLLKTQYLRNLQKKTFCVEEYMRIEKLLRELQLNVNY